MVFQAHCSAMLYQSRISIIATSWIQLRKLKANHHISIIIFRIQAICATRVRQSPIQREKSHQCNERNDEWSNRMMTRHRKFVNISPGKWACPNIWFEWRVSISTHNVRAISNWWLWNQCVVVCCFFFVAEKIRFPKIYTVYMDIYRCLTAHRSDEDNTNNCKITRKKWEKIGIVKLEYHTGSHSQLVDGIARQPSFSKLYRH